MQSIANLTSSNAYPSQQNVMCSTVAQVRFLYLRIFGGTKVLAPVDYAAGSEKPQV